MRIRLVLRCSRLQDKLRLLHEDLDSERELRQRIERERSDLQCQLIALSDRLEEAEGGAETQCEMNKKRDTELSKLRYVSFFFLFRGEFV